MLIVQKYGGSSVGDLNKIQIVADKIIESAQKGNQLVVVVSAMGGETNRLLESCRSLARRPKPREMDVVLSSGEQISSALLAIALNEKGRKAVSMSGKSAGIKTTGSFTKARILDIDPAPIRERLDAGYIVVVAGFQGGSEEGDITTLGRGSSDLSAVAIAGVLKSDLCEIYTDVDGVYTADPRIVPDARRIRRISYDEMLELSSLGAKVLQLRSVEMARRYQIDVITRSTFKPGKGTLLTGEDESMEQSLVSGIALDNRQARVSLLELRDEPGIACKIFNSMSEAGINIDIIVQALGEEGLTNMSFTVSEDDLDQTREIIQDLAPRTSIDQNISKVSVIGVGMKSHSGVAVRAFTAMAEHNINILMISTSEIKISMIIALEHAETAMRALHDIYDLGKEPNPEEAGTPAKS